MKQYFRFLPLGLFALPLFLIFQPVRSAVSDWLGPVIVDAGYDPDSPSMAVINDKPAMAYVVQGNGGYTLAYQPALDVDGIDWKPFEERINAYYSENALYNVSLAEINGRPAMSYFENNFLYYVRALDSAGDAWGTPVALTELLYVSQIAPKLFVIDNVPTILYDSFNGDLGFVRAQDEDGVSWDDAFGVGLDSFSYPFALALVNGLPAVAYVDSLGMGVRYAHALDSDGMNWSASVYAFSTGKALNYGSISLTSPAGGKPTLAFTASPDYWEYDLHLVEAKDNTGQTWGKDKIIVDSPTDENVEQVIIADMGGSPIICYNFYSYFSGSSFQCFASNDLTQSNYVDSYAYSISLLEVNGHPALGYIGYNKSVSYTRALDSVGSQWGGYTAITQSKVVGYPSALEQVEGLPAVGYYRYAIGQPGSLVYAQGQTTQGETWATPVVVDQDGDVGRYHSLTVVNGKPAFSYYDFYNGDLKYVRALDASGATWGNPIVVDFEGDVGRDNYLAIIDGRPMIAYIDNTNGQLKIVRAADADGTNWDAPRTIPQPNLLTYDSLFTFAVIKDRLAVAFRDSNDETLYYAHAVDVAGSSWTTPESVSENIANGEHGLALVEVHGYPAVVFSVYDPVQDNYRLFYSRATNTDGSSWDVPLFLGITLAEGSSYFLELSLAMKDGKPIIAYRDNDIEYRSGIYYLEATDNYGAAWDSPQSVVEGIESSLAVIGGCPAISYHDYPDLGFVRQNCLDGPPTVTPTATATVTTTPTATPTSTPKPPTGDAYVYVPIIIK